MNDRRETSSERTARFERERAATKQRNRDYYHWLECGSDDLNDAWVSLCPHAQNHNVRPYRLTEIIELIRTGDIITVEGKFRDQNISIEDNQAEVRRLYRIGCAEAGMLNLPRIQRLLAEMGLKEEPDRVQVEVEQPKENTKLFYINALVVAGVSHPVRQRVVYHVPHVLGKARADDAKKWTPGVTLAGLCLGQRNMNYVVRYTGLYPIDLDDTADVPQLRSVAMQHPFVRLVFTSITGSGMRACASGPVARDPDEYTDLYKKISARVCRELGVESKADKATCDPARLTFLPYDPEVFFQP